jgi:diacylglycerol kinase
MRGLHASRRKYYATQSRANHNSSGTIAIEAAKDCAARAVLLAFIAATTIGTITVAVGL